MLAKFIKCVIISIDLALLRLHWFIMFNKRVKLLRFLIKMFRFIIKGVCIQHDLDVFKTHALLLLLLPVSIISTLMITATPMLHYIGLPQYIICFLNLRLSIILSKMNDISFIDGTRLTP